MRTVTVFSLLLAGAGSATAQQAAIPVIENERPLWAKGREWRVSERPLLDIGKAEAEPEYELSQIRGMLRLPDGVIVVANQQNELRYYDKNGKYIRTAGRKGEGPGEFFQIQRLVLLRDGNIGVEDFRHGIQIYSPDGKFVRRNPPPHAESFASAIFDDGTVVHGDWPQGRRGVTSVYTDSVTLKRASPDGTQQVLGTFPATRKVPHSFSSQVMQFGPVLSQAARGQSWYIGFPEKWEVAQNTASGKPVRLIRRAWQPVEITAVERQAYREAFVNQGGEAGAPVRPSLKAQRESMVVDDAFAKSLPAYAKLHVDAAGNLWAQVPTRPRDVPFNKRLNDTNDKPQEWSVFDPAGRWLGQVQTPGNFWVFEIGNDYVLGLWRDEFDVEHVRMHTLTKPR
ncbi:MAG: 6-bladed beta-propeller [Gemmatimonadota bacterium]